MNIRPVRSKQIKGHNVVVWSDGSVSIDDVTLTNSEARSIRNFFNKPTTRALLGVASMQNAPGCIRCGTATRLTCPGCWRPLCSYCADDGNCGACKQAAAYKVEMFKSPVENTIEIEMPWGGILDIVHIKPHGQKEEVSIVFYKSREQERPSILLQFHSDRMRRIAKIIDDIIA